MTTRILQISDLHFGPPFVPEVGAAVIDIAPRLRPDIVVASGDFTQRAKEHQFAEAREFLDKLPPVPQVVVPGNHDVPLYRIVERLTRPHELYRQYISEELDTVLVRDDVVIVGLDSSAPRRAITNGRLHTGQLDFCRDAFASAPKSAARIVVAHHHFAPAPDYLRDQTMPGAKRAIQRFVELGVEMVLGGHLHRAYIGSSLDFYPGNMRDRGIVFVQCGTTTSRRGRGREREKNSFNVIDIEEDMIHVTHYMFFNERNEFAPFSRYLFPRPGKQFVEPLPRDRQIPDGGAAAPADGQRADGQPGDEQPADEQPGDEQPGDEQPGDGQPGDGQPGDGQPGDGQPGDGQPGDGQAGDGRRTSRGASSESAAAQRGEASG